MRKEAAMFEIKIVRNSYSIDRTIGKMFVPFDGAEYATMEPNLVKAIPKGRYKLTLYKSPKFKREVLLLHDVPGRQFIEIHHGNYPKDTSGCILVGCRYDESAKMLRFSQVALNEIINKAKAAFYGGHELWVRIE